MPHLGAFMSLRMTPNVYECQMLFVYETMTSLFETCKQIDRFFCEYVFYMWIDTNLFQMQCK